MLVRELINRALDTQPGVTARRSSGGHPRPDHYRDRELILRRHLTPAPHAKRIGAYCPGTDGMTTFGVLDVDGEGHAERVADVDAVAFRLFEVSVDYSLIIESTSGTGYHLWFVFAEPVPASEVRTWLASIVFDAGYWNVDAPMTGIEIFPKQDVAPTYGNLVWCPGFRGGWDARFDYTYIEGGVPPHITPPNFSGSGSRGVAGGREPDPDTPPLEQVAELLHLHLDPDCGRDDWWRVLAVLQQEYGEDAYEVARSWSEMGTKFDEVGFESTWKSFEGGSDLGYGTLIHILRNHGFDGFAPTRRPQPGSWNPLGVCVEPWTPSIMSLDAVQPMDYFDHVNMAEHLLRRLYGDSTPIIVHEDTLWQYHPPHGTYYPLKPSWVRSRIADYSGTFTRVSIKPDGSTAKPKQISVGQRIASSVYNCLLDMAIDWSPDFDEWPAGVAFRNGFLDARGLSEHRPENLCRHYTDTDFDMDAENDEWDSFLDYALSETTGPESVKRSLQQFAGGLFMGDIVRHQRALLLYGPGNTGKSTFMQVLSCLIPSEYTSHIEPQDFDSDSYAVADLSGMKLNVVADIDHSAFRSASRFKRIVEGESLRARQPGQRSFTLRPHAAQVFGTNSLPSTRDASSGFLRRWLVVGFHRIVPMAERDPDFTRRLVESAQSDSWLYAWAYRGYLDLQESGRLHLPTEHTQNIDDWRKDMSPFHTWWSECVESVAGDNDWVSARELYDQYTQWCKQQNLKPYQIATHTNFGIRLKETQTTSRRVSAGRQYQVRLKKTRAW